MVPEVEMSLLTREQIAQRISQEVEDGFVVNLGIGIPTLVANYIPQQISVMLQSENGLLGLGPFPTRDELDPDLINAGKQTVTALKGASFFDSAQSFAMIRGGHVDLTVLGAMEVDEKGSIANWMVPGKLVKGMGGAMDLVAGAKRVIAAMQHRDRAGNSKILKNCALPLTGVGCIKRVVTDMAVLDIGAGGFVLKELAPGMSVDDVRQASQAQLQVAPNVHEMRF
jgi:3-oxoacid CoA-transferase subunit B